MIKKTLYFGNPAYLSMKNKQMVVRLPDKSDETLSDNPCNLNEKTVPIEDIGMVVLDHPQITITHALLVALNENNTAMLSCGKSHMPLALMLPLSSHHAYTEKLYLQLESSLPLRKNLWQQTVVAKIANQSALLRNNHVKTDKMDFFIRQVKSGDPENVEGRAAAYYWDNLFGFEDFTRHRFGNYPNNMLNYGYAILRGTVARALVSSGLLPALGIHHRNKYNPYCLADDVMEPFRPYVDRLVLEWIDENEPNEELTVEMKHFMLQIPAMDITIDGKGSPLMVGVQRTTASVAACFEGSMRKILYPVME